MFQRVPAAKGWICLGVGLLGTFCSILPVLSAAEENLGLHLLYWLRGPEKPPPQVAIVAIDRASSKALNLPTIARKWPRSLHAEVLQRLTAQGAAVVVFDLIFYEPQTDADDRAFAGAIRQAGNVILTRPIDRQTMALADPQGQAATRVSIEKMVSAIPLLAEAALNQAPFPLPKVPIKLNQYWRFSPGSGDEPTLPVVALHVFAREVFPGFLELLRRVDPDAAAQLPPRPADRDVVRHMIEIIQPLYMLFKNDRTLADRLANALDPQTENTASPQPLHLMRALISLYATGNSRYLNFYGPPRTIRTISYHHLLNAAGQDPGQPSATTLPLQGKAVFVGQTESDWLKSSDGFYTAFTDESGADISGVEIAATAFANLVDDKAVRPLGPWTYFAVLLGWGASAALISLHFTTRSSASGLLLFNGAYLALALMQFKAGGTWYPLVVPMLIQSPAAFIAGLIWKHRQTDLERRNIRSAFGHYLPDEVVDRLASNAKALESGGQVLYSICLFTDAESYTPLSEKMDPASLTALMNDYYEVIFKPIKARQGMVLQVVGDSVLAMWTAPQPRAALRSAACSAAVEITEAVAQFNAAGGEHPLPTRIGIHAGEVMLGNIGAMDHFEYRPVGDIVNTASRLEGLNKFLGTRMLTSEEACDPGNGLPTRPVGRFVFKGKSRAVNVREILPAGTLSGRKREALHQAFADGLEAFQQGDWQNGRHHFERALQLDHGDGPSRFYLDLCRRYRSAPPEGDWDGTVHLDEK